MPTIKALAGVARAPFLLLPITLIASGSAAAYSGGSFSWLRCVAALVGLVALHMAVNIFNEWSDMRTGIDLETERTPFSGGSGTLPAGEISLRATLIFGVLCAGLGLAIGIWFLLQVGWPLVPILVLGALSVLAYTDLLARMGAGELCAGLGLGALPVIGAAMVQTGNLTTAAAAAAVPAFFMTFNLLLLNEFPDEEADRRGGRKNLIILLGRQAGAMLYSLAAIATPVAILAAVLLHHLPMHCLAAMLPSLLLVKPLAWALSDAKEAVPVPALGANVIWNLATNTLMAIALIVAAL